MPDLFFYSAILVGLYFFALVVITYKASKKETVADFAIGSRKVGLFPTIASIGSGYRDGTGLVVVVSLAAMFGFHTLWFFVALGFSLMLLSVTAKRVRIESEQYNYVTLSDLIKHRIGHHTALVSSVLITVVAFLYAASQINISGNIFSLLFGLSVPVGIVITVGVVALYLAIGGYKTVIKTDVFQWLVILTILIIPFLIKGISFKELPFFGVAPLVDYSTIWGVTGISFFIVYSYPDVWQRIFSTKSPIIAKKSLILTAPLYFLISLGLILFGISVGMLLGGVPEGNPFFALFSIETISPLLLALVGVFVLASVMSTLDTQSFLFAQTLSRNLFKHKDEVSTTKRTRIILIIFLSLLAFLASTIDDVIQFLFNTFPVIMIFAPMLFYYAIGKLKPSKHTDKISTGILVLSALLYAILSFMGVFENLLLTMIPVIVSLVLFSVAVLFLKNSEPEGGVNYTVGT